MNIDYHAKVLWDYHHLNHIIRKSDIIVGFGSHDLHVAQRCAQLFLDGYANMIIFTGGFGRITKNIWNMAEADKFAEIAVSMGVPRDRILIENNSTNTGENIKNTKNLINNLNLSINSYIIVDKPYRERRTFATLKKQWSEINFTITSPQYSYEDYCEFYSSSSISKHKFISIMVGDLQRVDLYSENGFQIKQNIPSTVWSSYDKLVSMGFNSHLCNI